MKEVKIAFISRLGGIGGGETSLINLIKGLDGEVFEKYVVASRHSPFTESIRNHAKIVAIPFGHPLRDIKTNILKIVASWIAFYKFLKKYQIDIVHTNDVISTFFAAPMAKVLRIPVVMTSHGWWDSTPIRNWFYDKFLDKILCVSKFVGDSYLKNMNGCKLPLEVVYLGVDINKFLNGINTNYLTKEFELDKDTKVISIFGRFQEIKGHKFFLKAAEIVLKKTKENVKFFIVGSPQFDNKEEEINFQQILKRVNDSELLRNHVVFTGFRNDIPALMNLSDIVISSSLCETFGMTIIEAMACSKPVISTYVGAPPEIIEDGVSGYLVPPADSQAIAEKIILLLGNPTLCKSIGEKARERVEKNFSLDIYLKKVENIYFNLLREK